MFAFEGGYHGRTLGASAITSSYRYRRRCGHFGDRAHFIPFPYHFRGPNGMSTEDYGHHCVEQVRASVRERIQRGLGSEGRRGRVCRLLRRADPGHRRLRHSTEELLCRARSGCSTSAAFCWSSMRSRWVSIAPASFGRSNTFGVKPDAIVFGKAHHQRAQSAGGRVGARGADQSHRSSRPARRIRPSAPTRWARRWRSRP